MRVLVFSDLWVPFPGGAERLVFNVARDLARRGHEIHVLTSYGRAIPGDPSVHLDSRDVGVRERHAHGAAVLADKLAEVRPDLILTHHFFAREFADEVFGRGIPTVQLVHNGPRDARAELAVFNSEHTARQPRSLRQPHDLVLLPPAFEDCVAASGPRDCLGFVKPIHHKGIDFLYRLAERLPDRRFLVLRGEWHTIEDIRSLPNVEFVGPLPDVRDFYGRCRVTLMPSTVEDAGTIPQESALNGTPCISSNVGGLPETNGGGIVLPHDLHVWVRAIEMLDSPAYHAEVAARQRAYVDSLDWPATFARLDDAVRRLAR